MVVAVLSATLAPDFSSSEVYFASEFTSLSLGDYKGKWLVIYFVPHEFTLKQVDHMIALNENLQKFKQFSAEVVVVAPESKHQIKSVVDRPRADGGLGGVDFPIVSDINGMVRAHIPGGSHLNFLVSY
jgi:peroxiredoxin 2/4